MAFDEQYLRLISALNVNTQEVLAHALGIRQASISSAVSRSKAVPPKWLVTARMKYNLDPKYVITGEGWPWIDKKVGRLPDCFASNPGPQDQAGNDCFTCRWREECLR